MSRHRINSLLQSPSIVVINRSIDRSCLVSLLANKVRYKWPRWPWLAQHCKDRRSKSHIKALSPRLGTARQPAKYRTIWLALSWLAKFGQNPKLPRQQSNSKINDKTLIIITIIINKRMKEEKYHYVMCSFINLSSWYLCAWKISTWVCYSKQKIKNKKNPSTLSQFFKHKMTILSF